MARGLFLCGLLFAVVMATGASTDVPEAMTNMEETTTEYFTTETPIDTDGFEAQAEPQEEEEEEDGTMSPMDEEDVETARSPRQSSEYASDLLKKMYYGCIRKRSFSCIKPKVLGFLSSAANEDKILLTENLSIVRNGNGASGVERTAEELEESLPVDDSERREALRLLMLDKVDSFLASHDLKIRVPKEIVSGEMLPFIPKFLFDNLPREVRVPLSEDRNVQERGFIKKVVIPFLLGLKFKATALIPLALSLIALKTWKALTLGLLSLVLTGAMVILKSTKPKVVSYEVVHYTAAPTQTYDHHPYEHVSYDHGYGRALGAHPIVYRAYRQARMKPQGDLIK